MIFFIAKFILLNSIVSEITLDKDINFRNLAKTFHTDKMSFYVNGLSKQQKDVLTPLWQEFFQIINNYNDKHKNT